MNNTQVFDFRRQLGENHVWYQTRSDVGGIAVGCWGPQFSVSKSPLWIDDAGAVRAARHIAAYQANPGIANERVRQDRDWARFFGIEYHSPATAESEEG